MSWKFEYVFLILFSTIVDYYCALAMGKHEDKVKRKPYLILSFVVNLGLLFFFKYFSFFNSSLQTVFSQFNIFYNSPSFHILLPVGISFYTFQTLSYSFDVYRGRKKPETHFGYFALYVSYFPQLVAGPIERATRLLPQLRREHSFDIQSIREGLILMGWGFFRKIVIADNLAIYINDIYAHHNSYGGFSLLIALIFFAFQVYLDFSAYSEIAIGSAKVMGVNLMTNFKRPMLAGSIAELWQRWHISLITWFRDYVLIPMSDNRKDSFLRKSFNMLFIFFLSGLWHGAAWTFVLWGTLNGLWLVIDNQTHKTRKRLYELIIPEKISWLRRVIKSVITITMFSVIGVLFRSENLEQAWEIFLKVINPGTYHIDIASHNLNAVIFGVVIISALMVFEFFEEKHSLIGIVDKMPLFLRWSVFCLLMMMCIYFIPTNPEQFIYFEF
jgi:alginate O-acetyltransferase complex protein AlgI